MKRILVLLLAMLLLAGCAGAAGNRGFSGSDGGVKFTLPAVGEAVAIHTQDQAQCLDHLGQAGDFDNVVKYAQGIWENSHPLAVELHWQARSSQPISGYTVRLSKLEDMSRVVYQADTTQPELEVFNLEIGTTYYWTVTAHLADGAATSGTASFTTAGEAPRNLFIDGVTNARDLGGWATEDGGRVRQGMIFRSGRLNKSNIDEIRLDITDEGIQMLRDVLGVKTQIDVRGDEEAVYLTQSPLGDGVAYHRIPMVWDGNILTDNPQAIAQVFALLAKEENYPVLLHCNIGTDRTGALCFLINALLGVPEKELCMDYVFSNFGAIKGTRSADTLRQDYLTVIRQGEGDSLSSQTYRYLVSIGVAAEDLDAVIRILKEQPRE